MAKVKINGMWWRSKQGNRYRSDSEGFIEVHSGQDLIELHEAGLHDNSSGFEKALAKEAKAKDAATKPAVELTEFDPLPDDLASLDRGELSILAKERGLQDTGKKSSLVERLAEWQKTSP